VTHVKTMQVLQTTKYAPGVPIDVEATEE